MANRTVIGGEKVKAKYSMGYKIVKMYRFGVEYKFGEEKLILDLSDKAMLDINSNRMKGWE